MAAVVGAVHNWEYFLNLAFVVENVVVVVAVLVAGIEVVACTEEVLKIIP